MAIANLYVAEHIDTKQVDKWVGNCVNKVVEAYDEAARDGEDLNRIDFSEVVVNVTDEYGNNPYEALTIIAAYGWHEGLVGCDFDDSPWNQFEDDVYLTARDIIEDKHNITLQ